MSTVEVFDPATATWSTPATTGSVTARHGLTTNVVGDKIYVIGGSSATSYVATTDVFTPAPLGVRNADAQLDFEIAPNPTNGMVTFRGVEHVERIMILNVIGESIVEKENCGAKSVNVDLSKLPAGMYFARCVTAREVINRQLTKR